MKEYQRLIETALSQVGYHEKASNAYLDELTTNAGSANWTKYARDLATTSMHNGDKNGWPWCDTFVDWCFWKTFGFDRAQELLCQPNNSCGAGCSYSAQYFRDHGQFGTTPMLGAQIFFGSTGSEYHTGIVYDYNTSYVYTVEGNTSDMVAKRQYRLNNGDISGYGYPGYSDENVTEDNVTEDEETEQTETTETEPSNDELLCTVQLPIIHYGNCSEAVRAMQGILISKGYRCGPDGADGDYGYNTGNALKRFQKVYGLEADGICGSETCSALIIK